MADILLGLIGDNIAHSKAPLLHRLAGQLTGLDVQYNRLIPRERNQDFDAIFDACANGGYRGINITYPYKERAAARVRIEDELVRGIGAVNTVVFEKGGARGYNTDYSGYVAAYRKALGDVRPGAVCMIGAGGVGKAIAFALIPLGLTGLRLLELDVAKAQALAATLQASHPALTVSVAADAAQAADGAAGLINCTPVGMVGHGGTPLARELMAGARWAFDAVYTPVDTQFLRDAAAEGLTVVSGYELFFHQGVEAWNIFAGRPLDHAALREALAHAEDENPASATPVEE